MLMKCNANILILGAMRNANVMQMKCNANKCEKMHNYGSDPLHVTHQPAYFQYSFHEAELKF